MYPSWVIRENASKAVLLALYLREVLGIASPVELPRLREINTCSASEDEAHELLERQWRQWWVTELEPEAHPSQVPLVLVDEYGTDIALPQSGAELLAAAIVPHADAARAWADSAHESYRMASATRRDDSYRVYADTIAEHEREAGRRAHSFELNVEVLPLGVNGVWWVGSLTVAVTDSLRADASGFDAAIHRVIAEIA